MSTIRKYEAPEDYVDECLAQLDRDIKRLRTALIRSFTVIFGVCLWFLI